MRIASLRLIQDFADIIHWVLDFLGVSGLFTLDYDGRTDHPVAHRDVN